MGKMEKATINQIKEWRRKTGDSLHNFFVKNNICDKCHGDGIVKLYWNDDAKTETCPVCNGDGKYVSNEVETSCKRIEELEHALRRVLPLFESYVQEMGVCDHAVDICICEDKDALEELKRVMGKDVEK